jgi:guanine deaminase
MPGPKGNHVFVGRTVSFADERRLVESDPGFIAVNPAGTILDCGAWNRTARARWRAARTIRFDHALVMPGFVDTHLHLPQMHVRGIYGADLLQWLSRYILPAEAQFANPRIARCTAREFFAELLRNGTTTALVYSSVHARATDIAFEEAGRAGIRAIIGKVMMDRNVPVEMRERTDRSLAESLELFRHWEGYDRNRLQYAFAPRFAPCCSARLMRGVGQLAARNNARITTHLAETLEEVELTRRRFPGYASYTELYFRLGLLGPRTVAAHCIHLAAGEYGLLARTDTRVAHCPSANLFLHAGSMDLRRMEKENITVGLGTDVGAGPSFSLFTVMQNMYFLHETPPRKAFFRATLGGARALGLDQTIGSFEPGKEADFIVVNCPAMRPWLCDRREASLPIDDLLAQLMFRGDDRLIRASYVRGREVYRRTN